MDFSPKQKEFFEIVYKIAQERKLNPRDIKLPDFLKACSGHRFPWKVLNEFRVEGEKDKFDFTVIFDSLSPVDFLEPIDFVEPLAESVSPVSTIESNEDSEEIDATVLKKKSKIPEAKRLNFINPVYTVEVIDSSESSSIVAVSQSFAPAWKARYLALHDNGDIEFDEAEYLIETEGYLLITSIICNTLRCRIRKHELK